MVYAYQTEAQARYSIKWEYCKLCQNYLENKVDQETLTPLDLLNLISLEKSGPSAVGNYVRKGYERTGILSSISRPKFNEKTPIGDFENIERYEELEFLNLITCPAIMTPD